MKAESEGRLPGYLFVVPWELSHVGGVNEVVRNLYGELETQGLARTSVLVPRWQCRKLVRENVDDRNTFNLKMPSPPPFDSTFPKKAAGFLVSAPTTAWQLYALVRDYGITVVNPHFPGPHLFHFALLKKCFPRLFRFIVSFHGSDVIAVESGAPGSSIVRWVVACADLVTVPSQALASRLSTAVPGVSDKITCIYNGIAPGKFLAPEIGISNCETAAGPIIHVGSFDRIKGQDILLHAFKEVLKARPDIRLLMVGRSGSFVHELEQLGADLGIAHAVTFMRDVPPDRIAPLMAQASFLVLPSRYEGGIPLVLLEAGAVGKTVVASRVGGVCELITDRENGLLVPVEAPPALAQAILTLWDDRQLRKNLEERLHRAVSGSFSWTKTAELYFGLATGMPHYS